MSEEDWGDCTCGLSGNRVGKCGYCLGKRDVQNIRFGKELGARVVGNFS